MFRNTNKLMLNSLYGRFGMKEVDTESGILTNKKFHEIAQNHELRSAMFIGEGEELVIAE